MAGNSSLDHLVSEITSHLAKKDICNALLCIQNGVERIIEEPLCAAQVFESKRLDALCQLIGQFSFDQLQNKHKSPSTSTPELLYGYVATKLQISGGHTRVIEDFISARPKAKHIIFLTGVCGQTDDNCLSRLTTKFPKLRLVISPRCSLSERLTWLQVQLLSFKFKGVYLFNHHQDSVAVAAFVPSLALQASFYHHGDHHLCLGVHLTHLEHIDFHPMGYHLCRQTFNLLNTYYPLTATDLGVSEHSSLIQPVGLVTCTAAGSNKVETPYVWHYTDMVVHLLKHTQGRHIHIGRLSLLARLKIALGLSFHGVPRNKFIYIPWVSSVWDTLKQTRVNLYIASFPYGGARTLVEVMGAGVPVATHKHVFSPILSCKELAYPSAFQWSTFNELYEYCTELNTKTLAIQCKHSRLHYDQNYSSPVFNASLMTNGIATSEITPIESVYAAQTDAWAFWVLNQIKIHNFLKTRMRQLLKLIAKHIWTI